MATRIQFSTTALWNDQAGFIVSIELVLLATIVAIGSIVALAALRDSLISEISDVAGAVQDLNNSYSINGIASDCMIFEIAGSGFLDALDFCDSAEDLAGAADNCITFDAPPAAESDEPPKTVELSALSSFAGTGSNANSATGTFGDGSIDTNFSVTTDGEIVGFSGNRVRFREGSDRPGTFLIDFDDPLTDVEFWVGNFTNVAGQPQNLLGNFTVTLSDGTVLNNAAFDILPDAIAPNSTFGEFATINSTSELLTQVVQGGANWVTDPTFNGGGTQAGGRIVFRDIPTIDLSGSDCVGITSIEFESSGGPAGYSAFFGVSGQVVEITP